MGNVKKSCVFTIDTLKLATFTIAIGKRWTFGHPWKVNITYVVQGRSRELTSQKQNYDKIMSYIC